MPTSGDDGTPVIDDELAATKAQERRARLTQLMGDGTSNSATTRSTADKEAQAGGTTVPGAFQTASKQAHRQVGKAANNKKNPSNNSDEENAQHDDNIPSALLDLEHRIAVQRDASSKTVLAKLGPSGIPGSATQISHEAQQLSTQEHDLLAKSSGGRAGATQAKGDLLSKPHDVKEHRMVGAGTGTTLQAQLQANESNAMLKQHLPSEIPDPREEDSRPPVFASRDTYNEEPVNIRAEIVDDDKEREKMRQEAQNQLISSVAVATKVDEADEQKKRQQAQCQSRGIVLVGLLLLAAMVLGGVCGSGKCSSSPSAPSEAERAKGLLDFIQANAKGNVSSLTYPFEGPDEARTSEQEALSYLVETDALGLIVSEDGAPEKNWRVLQRYALLVIWFTNGPFQESTSPIGSTETVVVSATTAWLVESDECGWSGVVCDTNARVVALELQERDMSGTIPQDLGLLSELTRIQFDVNFLTGTLSDAVSVVAGLNSLKSLGLEFNALEGSLPESLSDLTALTELNVQNNGLTGTIPETITEMTQLEVLELSFNMDLGGTIPAALSSLTSLKTLGLGFCRLSGPVPVEIFQDLNELEALSLGSKDNPEVLEFSKIRGLSKLTDLALVASSFVEGSIPTEVGDWWPDMKTLVISGSSLTGSIPSSVAQWTQLETLLLSLNMITGTIPDAAFEAWSKSLKFFGVGFNNMNGPLPSGIGLWTNLLVLNLNNNRFDGTLPTTLGMLSNLQGLALDDNKFTGAIPAEVVGFEGAYQDYRMNNFTGAAPHCENQLELVPVKVDCLEVSCPCCEICN